MICEKQNNRQTDANLSYFLVKILHPILEPGIKKGINK